MAKDKKTFAPVRVDRAEFAKVLAVLNGAIEARNTIPVLANVAIEHVGGRMRLLGTNLDQTLSVVIAATGGDDFSTTVDSRRLLALVKSMDDDTVALSIDAKGKLVVAGDDATASLFTIAFADFPILAVTGGVENEIEARRFAADLAFVAPAISTEEARYYLNGICLWPRGGDEADIAIIATDGHRLHFGSMPTLEGMPVRQPILPTVFCTLVRQLVAAFPDQAAATLTFHGSMKVTFAIGDWQLTSRLIDGQFPDWTRVVPAPGGVTLTVPALALAAAVNSAASISGERTRAVRLVADDGGVRVACSSPEAGEASARARGSVVPAFDFPIGFNHKYLLTAVKHFGAADIEAQLTDSAAPALFTSPQVAGRQIVLMPMRV